MLTFYAPLRRRGHIALHMSVCPSVTFLFPINQILEHLYLPSSNFVHTAVMGSRFWGHLVKCQGHQGQMFQNHIKLFKKQFPETHFFIIHLCNLFWTDLYPVVQNVCDKKALTGGSMLYKHLVFFWKDEMQFTIYFEIIVQIKTKVCWKFYLSRVVYQLWCFLLTIPLVFYFICYK